MSRLVRSFKLLAALPVVRHVLHSAWLVDSARAGHFVDPAAAERYRIDDTAFRDSFGVRLRDVLDAPNRRQLFAGRTFHVTPGVRPTVRELRELIELCGGRVERQRRSVARCTEANAERPGSYVILSCAADLHLLADLVRPGRPHRAVCGTELVMMAIVQQRVDTEKHVIKWATHTNGAV